MKRPDDFLTNTDTATGRSYGEAVNNPGDNTGTGIDAEIYNDPAYAAIAVINSYKEDGISQTDETTSASDFRDAIEELTERAVDSISEWEEDTIYSAVTLVMRHGYQFVAYNLTGNTGFDPISNPDYWYKIPKSDTLLDQYFSGEPVPAGLSSIADRSGDNYQQNILFGKYRIGEAGESFYNFYRVALDGTTITGDSTLEAIFNVDETDEYWNLDMIAPEVLSSRTLIDMGGKVTECQTESGGYVDTMGDTHDDYMQRIRGSLVDIWGTPGSGSGVFSVTDGNSSRATTGGVQEFDIAFDSADSTSPNTAKTDDDRTAHAALVTGISYLVVMVAA